MGSVEEPAVLAEVVSEPLEAVTALARMSKTPLFQVSADRIEHMLQLASKAIQDTSTVEDAKKITELTEALNAMSKKLDVAAEVKKSALRLVVLAEKKLGEIMRAMPLRTIPSKTEILATHGIDKRRSSLAQSLAKIPDKKIDKVIDGGARSIHAVQNQLGLLSDNYALRERRMAAYKLLCEEAVALLDRSVRSGKMPHPGTVAEMVGRLNNIQAQGFAKGFVRPTGR